MSFEEMRANAKLIASAPELLTAVKELRTVLLNVLGIPLNKVKPLDIEGAYALLENTEKLLGKIEGTD